MASKKLSKEKLKAKKERQKQGRIKNQAKRHEILFRKFEPFNIEATNVFSQLEEGNYDLNIKVIGYESIRKDCLGVLDTEKLWNTEIINTMVQTMFIFNISIDDLVCAHYAESQRRKEIIFRKFN